MHLVTGGCGFIGSALAKRLGAESPTAMVRVLDNEARGNWGRFNLDDVPYLDFAVGDIRDADVVTKACDGIDTVWHLAAVNGTQTFYDDPGRVLEVGIEGTLNVIRAAAKAGVKTLMLASSSEVYHHAAVIPTPEGVPYTVPDPLNPRFSYAVSKIAAEMMAIHLAPTSMRVVIFRPHNVYGPDMGEDHVVPQLVRKMLASTGGRVPIQGSGRESRSFIYIDDAIDALLTLHAKGEDRGIYNVGTQDEIGISTLAVTLLGLVKSKADGFTSGKLQPGGTPRRCPDVTRLRALGWAPNVMLAAGLRKTADWYANNPRVA